MPPHSLTSFKIQKYYQNEARFNSVYSRDNLSHDTKDGVISMSTLILELIALVFM